MKEMITTYDVSSNTIKMFRKFMSDYDITNIFKRYI